MDSTFVLDASPTSFAAMYEHWRTTCINDILNHDWVSQNQVSSISHGSQFAPLHVSLGEMVQDDAEDLAELIPYIYPHLGPGTGPVTDPNSTTAVKEMESGSGSTTTERTSLDSSDNNSSASSNSSKPQCWDHGCNGREFSSRSNYRRHVRERSGSSAKCTCPMCGAVFTRTSARDTHLAKQSCNRIRRYSNGRPRPSQLAILSSLGPIFQLGP